MAQILFGSDPTPANGDLDANFTELYNKTAYATSGIGYATGAGGAVTQLTSKTTSVTLNKNCGQITMNAASLAAGATVGFTVLNSLVAATDFVGAHRSSGGTNGAYQVWVDRVAAGGFDVYVKNTTGGALAESIVLTIWVGKSVTA